jgi:5'-3' exonuclease
VFDGKPCKQKNKVINHRKKIRERAKYELDKMEVSFDSECKYDELSSSPDEKEFSMKSIVDNSENKQYIKKKNLLIKKSQGIKTLDIIKCKHLFDSLLIPYIHVKNMEADSIFKYLQDYNLADYCYTNDTDAFAYGCNMLLDLNYSTDYIKLYEYHTIINELELSSMQMLEICICCGTDYTIGLKYITCGELVELFHRYGCLNDIMENKALHVSMFPYDFDYDVSFDIFNIEFPIELCNNISNFEYTRCSQQYNNINNINIAENIQKIYDSKEN